MKVILAGGRGRTLSAEDCDKAIDLCRKIGATEIVTGAARGVDSFGEFVAIGSDARLVSFPADWQVHGKAAGPIRNKEMAEYADVLIAFPGGKGTESMVNEAKKAGLLIQRLP